jgi:hypothetical protein
VHVIPRSFEAELAWRDWEEVDDLVEAEAQRLGREQILFDTEGTGARDRSPN